jgi:hypothetical protein
MVLVGELVEINLGDRIELKDVLRRRDRCMTPTASASTVDRTKLPS